jgi:hypothetical protein
MSEWRRLPAYAGVIEVSNFGGIRRVLEGGSYTLLTISSDAYPRVWLDGRRYYLHRLIAEAFCSHTLLSDKHVVVDHIDRNTHNCEATNLRFCTQSDNNRNRSKPGSRLAARPLKRLYTETAEPEMWITMLMQRGDIVHVSSHGRAFTGLRKHDHRRETSGYGRPAETGYLRCGLHYVHRLVATAFCENLNPTACRYVNHRDGNPHNNRVENLEWVTASENTADAWRRKKQRLN